MSNISRANPGALASNVGTTFLTNMNADRAIIYAHAVALQAQHELAAAEYLGKGTMPTNDQDLYLDTPTDGRVYCPVGYKAVIGAAVQTTAILEQTYTPGAVCYVFLAVSSSGALSLRVAATTTENANDILVATVDDTGGSPTIDNAPAAKSWAKLDLGDGTDGSTAGVLDAAYVDYTTNATPDSEDTVAHGLGRTPVGYIVVGRDKAAIVYDGSSSWDSTNIYLKCNVASTAVKLLVF